MHDTTNGALFCTLVMTNKGQAAFSNLLGFAMPSSSPAVFWGGEAWPKRELCTVTIEQWSLIGYCLFTLSWFRQFGQMMGSGHYYFDEMRSSFNLVQNQLFALTKLNIYKTNCLNLSNRTTPSQCRKREREIKGPWNLGLLKHLLNMYFLKCLKS
jgi:hypothetical protein